MKRILMTSVLAISMWTNVACEQSRASGNANLSGQAAWGTVTLPTLHEIKGYVFAKPYSCGGDYDRSALFLSEYSKRRNSPDLLFNGACGSTLYIEASTAGDDVAMISDLGDVPLEKVTASKALNYGGVVGRDNTFKQDMPVKENHTYVVMISKREIRALYALRVEQITSHGAMAITYAVKSYSIQQTQQRSPGFDWDKENK